MKMSLEYDSFLSLLFYDKEDGIEDDILSIEDWSSSEQDYESDSDHENDVVYPCYDPNLDWKLMKPVIGMKFENPAQLKESLIDYGVSIGYQLVFLAIVSVENKENWKWFLDLLNNDIEMEGGLGLTLISDQHKGIIKAVKDVFPYAKHRQCTRHIYANFKEKFHGLQFKNLFWAAANSTTEQQFEEKMNDLKTISKGAYSYLMERNPISWSRAFFEVGRACDAFENRMSESFNSRVRVARRKPIITMLEEIITFVMHRIFLMAKKAESLEHEVCPRIRKKLEDISKKQRHWTVIPSDNIIFEVRNEKDAYVVNIDEQTCTLATLAFINKDPKAYVSNWFEKDMFKETYKHFVKPLRGSIYWPKTDDIKPLPSKERRMPGRPTIKRKRDP
ncbi:hypothetical protein E3N88_12518 [Mikania micrantha]|uniref:MULE transposase domain-containing protein n=1 Tax=Mikania micrantha TaxID=192012 RepID=A0A5N6P730_9ASTR|nr:hypothetical protein E3N88_12518 [Mikania micrantha]